MIETNLSGVFYCCHAAIPHLRQRGGGWIINISSLAGKNPFAGGAAYCASKAGLNAFSEALMQEVRYDNIRVSCVMPGSVATGFGGRRSAEGADWKLAPEDVAQVVIDLLHDAGAKPPEPRGAQAVEATEVGAAVRSMLGSVAHYNLLERIGEGVLGDVYRARDTKVGRTVALKLQREPLPSGRRHERLVDDARAAAKISHPNIATLFDVGYYEGRLYLAYEFVKGTTLRQQMEGRPMNSRHALDLAAQVADALAHAHANGVIHKDLSPDTIVETAKGSAKVLDFGMSAWTRGGQTRALAAAAPHSVGAEAIGILSLRVPGAGGRRRCRFAKRSLFARRDRLRDADRQEPLRWRGCVDNAGQHHPEDASRADLDQPRPAQAARHRPVARARERPDAPDRERVEAGFGSPPMRGAGRRRGNGTSVARPEAPVGRQP